MYEIKDTIEYNLKYDHKGWQLGNLKDDHKGCQLGNLNDDHKG